VDGLLYLKEIQVENFKSFGRKLNIPFLQGFTAITGPNGSGKSNIADAILFVLGPKSSKAIRAGKLTDLIFNGGTTNRKPPNQCKVTLVFDNQSRTIPLDSDEVKLKRTVKISPTNPENYYSYFYVNGKTSSLSEFDNLLAHARISADGYNLVQQGDINRIIQMTNLERRKILDDIAGITKFDHDIIKAENQRGKVEENLDRINIILEEIRSILRQLKRDRNAALKYKELKDQLYLNKAQMAHKKKEFLETELKNLNNMVNSYEQERVKFQDYIETMKRKLASMEDELTETDRKIADMGGEETGEVKKKIEKLRLEQYRAIDVINTARDDIKELQEEELRLKEELSTIKKEMNRTKKSIEENKIEHEDKTNELQDINDGLKELNEVQSKSSTEIMSLQRDIAKLTKKIDTERDELSDLILERDRVQAEVERLTDTVEEAKRAVDKNNFALDDINWRLKEVQKNSKESGKELNEVLTSFQHKKAREKELIEQAAELEQTTKSIHRRYIELKAKADAAESIQKGYTNAVEKILEARDTGLLHGIHGTVAELAEVNEEYEIAMTIAAGNRMQAIIVENDEAAAQAIAFLKKQKLGRTIFLPINKMIAGRPRAKAILASKDPNAVGFAIDLVNFDEKYQSAFWYVFGDTVVIKDIDSGRKLMGGARLVTLEGDLFESSGAMVGGAIGKKGMVKFGAPSKSDIDEVAEKLQKATEHEKKISEELHILRDEIRDLEENIQKSKLEGGSATSKLEEFEAKKTEIIDARDELNKKYEDFKKLFEDQRGTLTKLEGKVSFAETEIESLTNQRENIRKTVIKSTPEKIAAQLKEYQDKREELRELTMNLDTEIKTLSTQLKFLTNNQKELSGKLETITIKIEENKGKIETSKQKREELEEELKTHLKIEESMSDQMSKLRDKRDEIFENKTKLEGEIDTAITRIETHGDLILQSKTELRRIEDGMAQIVTEIQSYDVDIKPEDLANLPNVDDLNSTIHEIEITLVKLEPVNMKAIEDYETQEKRKIKLEEELEALKEQRKNLITVVDNLKLKKKDGLMKVFDAVNENFQNIYGHLSENGTAELLLENPEDPFEGGLIIKANPGGKRVLRLEALSGGEKSLTALALIFSIQQYQPSPFYLLDEVDMFLDAINAESVARMVKHNSELAQFVMISLRKVSLKEANHVYGVTIQKNGITDIVGNINILKENEKGELIQPPVADEPVSDESPHAKPETHPPGPDHSPEVA
jgi:chromosome segregation protein